MQHFPLTEKLHTDVLEEKYGPISAVVIKHNAKYRESLLVDSKGIARTYALTFFEPWKNKEITAINEKIKQGEAIGKAFREKGYIIRKNVLDVFIIALPAWLKKEFHTESNKAKARLSEFYAKKSGLGPIIYGVVTEVYALDFRKPTINSVDKSQINATTKCLEAVGFSKDEIYRRIGDDNNYDDVLEKHTRAKKNSKMIIKKLKENINNVVKR
jgi:hypothetical protein